MEAVGLVSLGHKGNMASTWLSLGRLSWNPAPMLLGQMGHVEKNWASQTTGGMRETLDGSGRHSSSLLPEVPDIMEHGQTTATTEALTPIKRERKYVSIPVFSHYVLG